MQPVPSSGLPRLASPRPLGVAVVSVLAGLNGLFDILAGVVLVGAGATGLTTLGNGGVATLVGMVLLVIAFLLLSLAYGLWQMRPWAWSLGIGLEVANVIVAFVRLAGHRDTQAGVYLSVTVAALVILYLLQPAVREAFRRR